MKGGELRIPDDAGVVGQVVASGEPRRVDAPPIRRRSTARSIASWAIKRARCSACRCAAASGELFGAFEVINKLAGDFTADDEAGAGRAGRPRRDRAGEHAAVRAVARRGIGRSSSRRPKACS